MAVLYKHLETLRRLGLVKRGEGRHARFVMDPDLAVTREVVLGNLFGISGLNAPSMTRREFQKVRESLSSLMPFVRGLRRRPPVLTKEQAAWVLNRALQLGLDEHRSKRTIRRLNEAAAKILPGRMEIPKNDKQWRLFLGRGKRVWDLFNRARKEKLRGDRLAVWRAHSAVSQRFPRIRTATSWAEAEAGGVRGIAASP